MNEKIAQETVSEVKEPVRKQTFELDKDEEQLLEEFGVLMAAEYNYALMGG